MKPMTFCLTFDDGLRTQARVAAPLLEAYGWRGVFSVPTGIVTAGRADARQAQDMCIVGNESNVMSWQDVRELMARGHICCPHTISHADLAELEQRGEMDFLKKEIGGSKAEFEAQTGVVPSLFCLPHCTGSGKVAAVVRSFGMEPINGAGKWRVNFGQSSGDGNSYSDIRTFVRRCYYLGMSHVDIMIHGIARSEGGWMPFEDLDAFRRFLEVLREEERAGRIRVVRYDEADHSANESPAGRIRARMFWLYRHLTGRKVPMGC